MDTLNIEGVANKTGATKERVLFPLLVRARCYVVAMQPLKETRTRKTVVGAAFMKYLLVPWAESVPSNSLLRASPPEILKRCQADYAGACRELAAFLTFATKIPPPDEQQRTEEEKRDAWRKAGDDKTAFASFNENLQTSSPISITGSTLVPLAFINNRSIEAFCLEKANLRLDETEVPKDSMAAACQKFAASVHLVQGMYAVSEQERNTITINTILKGEVSLLPADGLFGNTKSINLMSKLASLKRSMGKSPKMVVSDCKEMDVTPFFLFDSYFVRMVYASKDSEITLNAEVFDVFYTSTCVDTIKKKIGALAPRPFLKDAIQDVCKREQNAYLTAKEVVVSLCEDVLKDNLYLRQNACRSGKDQTILAALRDEGNVNKFEEKMGVLLSEETKAFEESADNPVNIGDNATCAASEKRRCDTYAPDLKQKCINKWDEFFQKNCGPIDDVNKLKFQVAVAAKTSKKVAMARVDAYYATGEIASSDDVETILELIDKVSGVTSANEQRYARLFAELPTALKSDAFTTVLQHARSNLEQDNFYSLARAALQLLRAKNVPLDDLEESVIPCIYDADNVWTEWRDLPYGTSRGPVAFLYNIILDATQRKDKEAVLSRIYLQKVMEDKDDAFLWPPRKILNAAAYAVSKMKHAKATRFLETYIKHRILPIVADAKKKDNKLIQFVDGALEKAGDLPLAPNIIDQHINPTTRVLRNVARGINRVVNRMEFSKVSVINDDLSDVKANHEDERQKDTERSDSFNLAAAAATGTLANQLLPSVFGIWTKGAALGSALLGAAKFSNAGGIGSLKEIKQEVKAAEFSKTTLPEVLEATNGGVYDAFFIDKDNDPFLTVDLRKNKRFVPLLSPKDVDVEDAVSKALSSVLKNLVSTGSPSSYTPSLQIPQPWAQ